MVKKLKRAASQAAGAANDTVSGLMDSQLAQSVKESAQQIWLAGMGAFSKAQGEGNKVFETLVKQGINLQKKTQGLAEDKINEVTGRMTAMAGTVTAKAGQNWDKLEQIFEQRTAKAMNKLGVPTAADIEALVKRVDELAAAVARLNKSTAGAATPATRRRARPATKKVAAPVASKRVKTAAKKPAAKAPSRRSSKAA